MAAVLSSDMDNTDKVVVFIEECRSMGLAVVPPSVNSSEYRFTVDARSQIIYGLGAIKGVGEGAIETVLDERRRSGPFSDLIDFCRRVDLRRVNRRVLESLIRAGACDCLEPQQNRAALMAQLPEALRLAEQTSRDDAAGQNDLFGLAEPEPPPVDRGQPSITPAWDDEQRLKSEKETLGLYLTGHPIDRFESELRGFITGKLNEVASMGASSNGNGNGFRRYGRDQDRRVVVVAGLVVGIRTRNANRGGRMAFLTLDDRSARMEVRVFPEVFEQYREAIVPDQVLVTQGTLSYDDFSESMRLNAEAVWDIDGARQQFARRLVLSLDASRFGNGLIDHLAETLTPFRQGQCRITVDYTGHDARAEVQFDADWQVRPTERLLRQLRNLVGESHIRLEYR